MEKTKQFTFFITSSILISIVTAKDLRALNSGKEGDNEIVVESPKLKNHRHGRMFFNLFRPIMPYNNNDYYPHPSPPFMGGSLPILPTYPYPRPNPVWMVIRGAGSFVRDMLDIVASAVSHMDFDGGGNDDDDGGSYFGGGYDEGGDDSDDDDSDYRSLPMPPSY